MSCVYAWFIKHSGKSGLDACEISLLYIRGEDIFRVRFMITLLDRPYSQVVFALLYEYFVGFTQKKKGANLCWKYRMLVL